MISINRHTHHARRGGPQRPGLSAARCPRDAGRASAAASFPWLAATIVVGLWLVGMILVGDPVTP